MTGVQTCALPIYIQGADFMAVWQQGKDIRSLAYLVPNVKSMFDELLWWTHALRAARAEVPDLDRALELLAGGDEEEARLDEQRVDRHADVGGGDELFVSAETEARKSGARRTRRQDG